ncbi:AHH domain-containing protein [Cetobacterium somerae]
MKDVVRVVRKTFQNELKKEENNKSFLEKNNSFGNKNRNFKIKKENSISRIREKKMCDYCKKEINDKHNDIFYNSGKNREVNNDGQKLKKNMLTSIEGEREKQIEEEIKKKICERYELRMEEKENLSFIQAHHLISGNQVFADCKKLVNIAQGVGYDINNYENGIFLPTLPRDIDIKKDMGFEESKVSIAYEIMEVTKAQWHVGGHKYTIPKNTIKFNSYADEVKKLVVTYEQEILKKIKCCNDEKQNREIVEGMNKISLKIRKKLDAFKLKPSESAPFYVSKVALEYAFLIPEKIKFIAYIYEKNKRIEIIKYEISTQNMMEAVMSNFKNGILEKMPSWTKEALVLSKENENIILKKLEKKSWYGEMNREKEIEVLRFLGDITLFFKCIDGNLVFLKQIKNLDFASKEIEKNKFKSLKNEKVETIEELMEEVDKQKTFIAECIDNSEKSDYSGKEIIKLRKENIFGKNI